MNLTLAPARTAYSYVVDKALHGGFFVSNRGAPGDMSSVLFAGTLDECLEFIRKQLSPSHEAGKP